MVAEDVIVMGLSMAMGGARDTSPSARIWRRQLSMTCEVVGTDDETVSVGGVVVAVVRLLERQ